MIQRSTHGSSCRIIWMKYKLSVTKFSRSAKQLISADLRKYPTIKPRERVLPPPPYLYLSLSHSLHGPCSRMQPPKNRELVPVSMTRIMGTKKELVGKRGNVTWTGTFAAKRNQILKKKKKKRKKEKVRENKRDGGGELFSVCNYSFMKNSCDDFQCLFVSW